MTWIFMGSDGLFHKRKARTSNAPHRQRIERVQNKRYLIVCEGTKTEPNYFRELLDDLRVNPQIVRIDRNQGTSPDRVVRHALSLYEQDAISGDSYDAVYCVFDRDSHATFDAAVQRVIDLNAQGKPLFAITSTPCFEVWFILHFSYTTKPFHASGYKSVGDQVASELKKIPGFSAYGKGQKGIYSQLKDKLSDALSNAAQLRSHCIATSSDNPATCIDKLVLSLQQLAS
jgi:RloB-like protein